MQGGAHDAVCALADDVLDVILLGYVEGDLSRSARWRRARHGVGLVVSSSDMSVGVSFGTVAEQAQTVAVVPSANEDTGGVVCVWMEKACTS